MMHLAGAGPMREKMSADWKSKSMDWMITGTLLPGMIPGVEIN